MNKANFNPFVRTPQAQGKRLMFKQTVNAPRSAWIVPREWKPVAVPVTLNVHGTFYRVDDLDRFVVGLLMQLEAYLTGSPVPDNGWKVSVEQLLGMLDALGCAVDLEPIEEAKSEN